MKLATLAALAVLAGHVSALDSPPKDVLTPIPGPLSNGPSFTLPFNLTPISTLLPSELSSFISSLSTLVEPSSTSPTQTAVSSTPTQTASSTRSGATSSVVPTNTSGARRSGSVRSDVVAVVALFGAVAALVC